MKVKNCEKCSVEFTCGFDGQCWCANLPAVGDPNAGECLCPACLKVMIAEKIDTAIARYRTGEISNPALPYSGHTDPQSLVEGIDYHIDEGGLLVFSAWYHLKRGSCCGSGCRNCPYDHVNVP